MQLTSRSMLLLVISVFTVLTVGFGVLLLWTVGEGLASYRLVRVDGEVVTIHESDDGGTPFDVTYQYEYGDESYVGEQRWYGEGFGVRDDFVERYIDAHGPGTPIDVFVDPEDPTSSRLERGIPVVVPLLGLLWISFALCTTLFWVYLWNVWREPWRRFVCGYDTVTRGDVVEVRLDDGGSGTVIVLVSAIVAFLCMFASAFVGVFTGWVGVVWVAWVVVICVAIGTWAWARTQDWRGEVFCALDKGNGLLSVLQTDADDSDEPERTDVEMAHIRHVVVRYYRRGRGQVYAVVVLGQRDGSRFEKTVRESGHSERERVFADWLACEIGAEYLAEEVLRRRG